MKCTSGECISLELKCNHRHDCPDGSDERDCSKFNMHHGFQSVVPLLLCVGGAYHNSRISTVCGHGQFKCRNGQCIDERRKCDSHPDCADRSDEEGCHSKTQQQWHLPPPFHILVLQKGQPLATRVENSSALMVNVLMCVVVAIEEEIAQMVVMN